MEHISTTEPINISQNSTANVNPNVGTWSSIVKKTIPATNTSSNDKSQIIFNEDGSDTLKPPQNFLCNARKMWESSLISHFIGGSFDFKYVREQAFRMWKNMGLSRVFL